MGASERPEGRKRDSRVFRAGAACSCLTPGPPVVQAQMPGQPVGGARAQGGARLASPGSAGSLELEKVDGGFGRRPVSRAPERRLPGGGGPGCPGKGVCAPALVPWVFSGPASCPVPSLRRSGPQCLCSPGYGARLPTPRPSAESRRVLSAHRRLRGTSRKPGCPLPCPVSASVRLYPVFSLLWSWGLGGGRVSVSILLGSSAGSGS